MGVKRIVMIMVRRGVDIRLVIIQGFRRLLDGSPVVEEH